MPLSANSMLQGRQFRLLALTLGLLMSPIGIPSATATQPSKRSRATRKAASVIPATLPSMGSAQALVTIIEISDFQCPFCKRVVPTMRQVMKRYGKNVRRVWVNRPLPFHRRGKPAAIAALAAHRQGKFWLMHDKIFANSPNLSDENFLLWAIELGLDPARFERDLKDPKLAEQIDREGRIAAALGARGVPAFLINGKMMSGAQPIEKFIEAIDAALISAKKVRTSGKKGMALLEATFKANAPIVGPKAVKGFLRGEKISAIPRPPRPTRSVAGRRAPTSTTVWNVPVHMKTDEIRGNSAKAVVTIVVISDFECPFCTRGNTTINRVRSVYGDKVRLVFRHFPLPFHRQAQGAHQAAFAAGQQGKFWPFHDLLFANNRQLSAANYRKWAAQLGLHMERFDRDASSQAAKRRVSRDQASARKLGVRGTPNFFVNGRMLRGALPFSTFKTIIDAELKKAKGRRGPGYYDQLMAAGKTP